MKDKLTLKNIAAAFLLQMAAIFSGFIIPRLILGQFGSEVNGLVSSLNQFLNYVSLLEGGVSGVIMAGLYAPLAEHDLKKVSAVCRAADQFFRKLALIFVVYLIGVACLYPLFVQSRFSWGYIASLAVILGANLFVQYFFSLTWRLLLNADRRGYVVSLSQLLFVFLNLILTVVLIRVFPDIHVIKLASGLAYAVQPLLYFLYIRKHYPLEKKVEPDHQALSQRWNGFGQNLAYFVHANTDIVVLTIFAGLTEVSVYSVYFMIANALGNLVISVSAAVEPSMGNALSLGDEKQIQQAFDRYELGIFGVTFFLFATGIQLLFPFVQIYTREIIDANYYRPLFGVLLMLAQMIYCLRSPYVNVTHAKGHFRETARYAYTEAVLNILLSVALVSRLGLVGVAIGTCAAMAYRMIAHILYLQKRILKRSPWKAVRRLILFTLGAAAGILLSRLLLPGSAESYVSWFGLAVATAVVTLVPLAGVVLWEVKGKKYIKNNCRRRL